MGRFVNKDGTFITNKTFGSAISLPFGSLSSIFERLVSGFGVILTRANTASGWSTDGQVTVGAGVSVDIAPFSAVVKDVDGLVRSLRETAIKNFDLSGYSNGTYKVLLEYDTTFYEAGTIKLTNASATVEGTNTNFTKDIDKNLHIVIVDSTLGNNGRYQVLSITDATHLELKQA